VLLLNPAASRMFGWEGDPVLGKPLPELLPEDLQQQLARPLMQIARGDQEAEEVRVNLTGPTKRVIRILLSPVSDPRRQNLKGIVMTVQDITREAELNEATANPRGTVAEKTPAQTRYRGKQTGGRHRYSDHPACEIRDPDGRASGASEAAWQNHPVKTFSSVEQPSAGIPETWERHFCCGTPVSTPVCPASTPANPSAALPAKGPAPPPPPAAEK
jgi:PAS domain S-box-containing protein